MGPAAGAPVEEQLVWGRVVAPVDGAVGGEDGSESLPAVEQ